MGAGGDTRAVAMGFISCRVQLFFPGKSNLLLLVPVKNILIKSRGGERQNAKYVLNYGIENKTGMWSDLKHPQHRIYIMTKALFGGLIALAMLAGGQELIRNGGFNEGKPQYGEMPQEWKMEGGNKGWAYVNDDGVVGKDPLADCILFNNTDGDVKSTVVQEIKCKQDTDYVLSANLKVQGCIPAVTLVGEDGKAVASIKGNQSLNGIWKGAMANFNTRKNKKLNVVLTGSLIPSASGKSAIDNVSLTPKGVVKAEGKAAAIEFKPAGQNIALGKPYAFTGSIIWLLHGQG